VIQLPGSFAVANLSAVGDDEISVNSSGRVANKGMEGPAPDGKALYGSMQSPLLQDSGRTRPTQDRRRNRRQCPALAGFPAQNDVGAVATPLSAILETITAS
jgi:hypothetical protein